MYKRQLEGSVTATLDNFAFKSQASILGEHVLDIHHCLVLHPDAKLEDVTCVASHAQGLAQCRRFLAERLPGRATITTSSTAESARMAAEDVHVAGIANAFAAELHGARVAERDIEDHFGNQTLFALIGRQGHPAVFRGERYKTSLALFLQVNRAGTLNMICLLYTSGVQGSHHVMVVQVVRERPDVPGQRAHLHEGPVGRCV